MEAAYKEMAEDREREDEALTWSEALLGDSWGGGPNDTKR